MEQNIAYRHIERALLDLDEVPLLGGETPTFPYSQVAADLEKRLGLAGLKIEVDAPQWRGEGEALLGVGEPTLPLRLICSPLDVPLGIAMADDDVKALVRAVLEAGNGSVATSDEPLCHSFYRFLAAETLHAASRYGFPPGLSLHLLEEEALMEGPALTIDIRIASEGVEARARLILPDTFVRVWRTHFTATHPSRLSPELQKELVISLHAESGRIHLTQEQWRGVEAGDFVTIDRYTPDEVTLTLEGQPLFRGIRSNEGIQIQTVEASMDNDDLEPFEEEEEEEEEEISLEEEEAEVEELLVSPSEIPVTLTIEVGRLKMTAEKLLSLQAGNMLELAQAADAPVDLTLSGKRVGRGELLKIGDVLGVRVLELGR
jgi:flagellar motor switch protein FliN